MSRIIFSRGLTSFLKITSRTQQFRRDLLTKAFWCNEAWTNHCQHKLLDIKSSKISLDEYSIGLEKNFHSTDWKKKPSGVDIDIYACNIKEKFLIKKLEDLVKRFRSSRRCVEVLPSTWHAFIRLYLQNNLNDALLKVLSDPLTYGIFATPHDFCLIYDHLLNRKDYRGAAKIAHLQMLQEDFNSHPLSTHMALYSCLKYMEDPAAAPWEEEKAPEEDEEEKSPAQEAQGMDDDEDEVQVVRVPFLYEPHHDDHFDLDDPQKILGKTLNLAGMAIDTPAGRACQIWGIGMYGKWEEAATIDLPRLVEAGNPILAEGVEKFRKYLSEVEDEEVRSQWTEKLEPLLSKLHTVPGDILPALEQDLNQLVATKEPEYISLQEKTYQEWIEARQAKWDKQVEDYEMVKRRKLIEQRKKELKDKEELLSFFDNWDKIHLELEKATAELNKEKLEKEEEYIVPEVKSWQRKMQEQAKEQDHISNANFD